jgi:hypothetical protein
VNPGDAVLVESPVYASVLFFLDNRRSHAPVLDLVYCIAGALLQFSMDLAVNKLVSHFHTVKSRSHHFAFLILP